MRLVPIDSTKNIVQFNTQVLTNTVAQIVLAAGVKPGDLDEVDTTKTYYVEDGCMIRGIGISLRCYNESGVADSASTVMALRKYENATTVPPAVPTLPGIGSLNALGVVPFKDRVFHVEQAITGSQVSGWPMLFPGVKIPKRFHKMGIGDYWILYIANNTGNNLRVCGSAIYKWYR